MVVDDLDRRRLCAPVDRAAAATHQMSELLRTKPVYI